VSKVSGEKLDQMENIITGLPVSDHDHGINGLEFGNDGELYFQVGSNTNAGVPGPISSRSQLDEGYFSAATLVAYLNRPNFDGDITYDKDGYPVTGLDVEVFASGQRNSFDIVLHSNGNLYATGELLLRLDSVEVALIPNRRLHGFLL
jgi:glucose/arabinose dehydrogenase